MKRYNAMPTLTVLGAMLLVVGALKAADVSENFEEDTLGLKPLNGKWSGYCAVSNNAGSYSLTTPGTPISDAAHTQMLSVEGSATRAYTDGESGDRVIDLLVMADDLPDEDLPDGSGDEQIKFAFDTNGCINLYHKLADGSASAQWSKLSDKVYSNGTWVRVSFGFDYANHRCQLKVDGSPLVSSVGYRAASGTEQPGSWYCLASNATALAAIDFVGCGGVDDVVNAAKGTYTPATGASSATNGVDFAWFDKNGLAWCDPATTTSPGGAAAGGSGYTLKQAFDTGVDPYSPDPLYITNASYTATQFTLTFNGCGKNYRVDRTTGAMSDGGVGEDITSTGTFASNVAENVTTWTHDMPLGSGTTFYRVRNGGVATAETVNQFAIMRVESTNSSTLVALPWRSLSSNTNSPTPITAANVVMTNTLVNGDWLLYYDSIAQKYKGWLFNGSAWVATANASLNGMTVAAAASDVTLERGQAIWLVRTTANGRNLNENRYFYLFGQHDVNPAQTTVPSGGALLANPRPIGTGVLSFDVLAGKISNAANDDEIRVPFGDNVLPKVAKKFSDGWKTQVPDMQTIPGPPGAGNVVVGSNRWDAASFNLPEGQGFMYIRKTSEGTAPTVNW